MSDLSLQRFKFCSKCGCTKPATPLFFYRNKRKPCGLTNWCKPCGKLMSRAYRKAKPEKVRAARRDWYERNREAEIAKARDYYREHAEHNRESNRKRVREWVAANKERRRAYEQALRQTPERQLAMRVYRATRRARELAAEGNGLTADEFWQMYEDQGGVCAYCEDPLFGTYHLDHMLPLSRGGSNHWDNLAVVCPTCNLRKNDKTAAEYMNERS